MLSGAHRAGEWRTQVHEPMQIKSNKARRVPTHTDGNVNAHTQAFAGFFRKVTELIQTEPASFAGAKIDFTIQVVVLQKEDQYFHLMSR